MIQAICNIRQTRRNKISPHLTSYLNLLCESMNSQSDDFRPKEALMHAFGLLSTHMAQTAEYQKHAETVLMQYIQPELDSASPFLKARASWVYGQFGNFPFENQDHLRKVLDSLYRNVQHRDLPVRVNAAVSLIKMLNHEMAVEFVRPGLEPIIKIYLKLIDDIDYDELIESLKRIVEVFENEISPYAVQLCTKLGEAYVRLAEAQRANQGGGGELEEDSETSLTAVGLITAIRRILKSISGMNLTIYPQLEEILIHPITMTLTDPQAVSVEEGLSCLSELLYNQQGVSGPMWNIYLLICDSLLTDKGILDDVIDTLSVPLINFMNKDPLTFKSAQLDYNGQKMTCLDIFCQVIGKCLQLQRDKEDEI